MVQVQIHFKMGDLGKRVNLSRVPSVGEFIEQVAMDGEMFFIVTRVHHVTEEFGPVAKVWVQQEGR